jgi:hypothetical protein
MTHPDNTTLTTSLAIANQRLSLHDAAEEELILFSAESQPPAVKPRATKTDNTKIRFDLARLNSQGLIGPPDGLRALHYEYCIPDQPEAIREVEAIDPTLQIQGGSPGRIGCAQHQLLCLGNTHQAGFLSVLERLSALPFVESIHEAFFE